MTFACLLLLTDIVMHAAFAALVAFCLHELVDLVPCIALLARELLALLDQRIDFRFVRCEYRRRSLLFQPVSFWLRMIDRFPDQPSTVVQPSADLSNTQPFQVIGLAYAFVVVHRFHLLCTSGFPCYRRYATVGSFSLLISTPGGLHLFYKKQFHTRLLSNGC